MHRLAHNHALSSYLFRNVNRVKGLTVNVHDPVARNTPKMVVLCQGRIKAFRHARPRDNVRKPDLLKRQERPVHRVKGYVWKGMPQPPENGICRGMIH
jgi:hypothetical protein